jgi:hypothetical protein
MINKGDEDLAPPFLKVDKEGFGEPWFPEKNIFLVKIPGAYGGVSPVKN